MPIHAGRTLLDEQVSKGVCSAKDAAWLKKHMTGDDTGDNISALNLHLNEMTAIYWAWKNYDKLGNPDYIGFMHYRRQFWLKTDLKAPDFLSAIGCTEADVAKVMKGYQAACLDLRGRRSLRQHLVELPADEKLLKDVLQVATELYPAEADSYRYIVEQERVSAVRNMFIFPWEEFFRYCEWIFSILFTLQMRSERFYNGRNAGYIAEVLTTLYLRKMQKDGKKVLMVDMIYQQDMFPPGWKRRIKDWRRWLAARLVGPGHKKYDRYMRFEKMRQLRRYFKNR